MAVDRPAAPSSAPLARSLLHAQPWEGRPRLFRLARARPGAPVRSSVVALDGHPADVLLGAVAPDDWLALGVSCAGWAATYAPEEWDVLATRAVAAVAPSAHPARARVRQATIVWRSGTRSSLLQLAGRPVSDPGPPSGLLVDCLLRAMDLPTDPAPVPAAEVATVAWCEALAALPPRPRSRRQWPWDAATAVAPPPDTSRLTWHHLRWAAVTGATPVPALDGATAAWMDDGMFARWLLPSVPPLADAVARAKEVLTPAAGRRLDAVVAAVAGSATRG